ncbi:MAG: octanoyltransferase [Gemmatimonadetes bacterium]|nr:MAG: octanoyltransferase [Gemmatimonadota bacterium]
MRLRLIEADGLSWKLLLEPHGRSGAENMALDAALLDRADCMGEAFLRLYRFDPPCLSLGRNEPTARYDRSAIARLALDVVRRPTGGCAVWHEHEVTYAVAAPIATFGGLREAYRAIHTRLSAALQSLGVDATLALARPRLPSPAFHRPGPCFATPVGGEVLVAGRKLVGSAQVRKRNAFLQHGSILLDGSQEIVSLVSRGSSVVSRETTLSSELRRHVSFDEVADAIVAAWDAGATSTPSLLDLAPLAAAVKS